MLTKEQAERIVDFGCFTGVKPERRSGEVPLKETSPAKAGR